MPFDILWRVRPVQPSPPVADDRPIWDIWLSSLWLPSITVADELGLFESLNKNPATAEELAGRLDLSLHGVRPVIQLLTSLGALVVHDGRFQLTPLARDYLLRDSPHFWGHVWSLSIDLSPIHARLRDMLVKAPQPAAASAPGRPEPPVKAWESGQIDLERAGRIARFMNSHSMAAAGGLARALSFEGTNRLLDVGGGSGCFSIALAHRNPQIRCTVMDLPAMCRWAQGYIDTAGISDRVDTRGIDMFREDWPRGYDAIFFSNIFHDWSYETCAKLAANAYAALPEGGRVYLHEMLLDDTGTAPRTAAAFSVLMLIGTRGQQFRFVELQQMLEKAGFVDVTVTPAHGYYSLVSGRKP
jgi:acetylserotonin N-methyltransferase